MQDTGSLGTLDEKWPFPIFIYLLEIGSQWLNLLALPPMPLQTPSPLGDVPGAPQRDLTPTSQDPFALFLCGFLVRL